MIDMSQFVATEPLYEYEFSKDNAAHLVREILGPASHDRLAPLVAEVLPMQRTFWGFQHWPAVSLTMQRVPLQLWRAPNAEITGKEGCLVFQTGRIAQPTLEFVPFGADGVGVQYRGEVAFRRPARRKVSGSVLLGFNAGHTNYAHFLADELFRLYYFAAFDHDIEYIALPNVSEGHFVRQFLRLSGIPERKVLWIDDRGLASDEIFFFNYQPFVGIGQIFVDAINWIKSRVDLPRELEKPQRIFLSRPDSVSRRLLNEGEIAVVFQEFGFEVVAPGLLSVEQQIRLFDSAEFVSGPHGAGLMNASFCRPGAMLLELFSEYTLMPMFWSAVSPLQVEYGYLSGTSFDGEDSSHSVGGGWDGPFVLSPELVRRVLRNAVG